MSRKRLPDMRAGKTHTVVIHDMEVGDHTLVIRANTHDDGELGEVFLNIGKPGGTLQGTLDGWAIMFSIGLQHGVPLSVVADKFRGQSFPPCGRTSNPNIPECSSLFDYVVRYLEGL